MKNISKILIAIGFFVLLLLIILCCRQKDADILKIGFLTDWEYSQSSKTFLIEDLIRAASAHYNEIFKPDLVIGGGNYANNLKDFEKIINNFERIKADKLYCLGKKDYNSDSFSKVKKILKLKNSYSSKIIKNIKVIILDTTENNEPKTSLGTISEVQLNWLKKELSGTEPVLIFSHHNLIETPAEDIWQENLTNQKEVFSLLKDNNQKILAVISGNTKNDYITKKSGIPFINIGGLSEELTLGRFSDIEIVKTSDTKNVFLINLENQGINSSSYEIKRDLEISTATRIAVKEKEFKIDNQKWFDLEDSNNLKGILNEDVGAEPNLNITKNGTIIAAFENKNQESRIQVKAYKNEKWINLADKNNLNGLVSFKKGSNPNIETKNEDVFVTFSEVEYDQKIRLLHWSDSKQEWNELSPQGFISEKPGHEPTLIFDKDQNNLYVAFAEQVQPDKEQTQAQIKKWDGITWQTIPTSLLTLADASTSSVDEFDLVASKKDNSIYLAYEEIKTDGDHNVRIKKWNTLKWNALKIDKLYFEKISKINGFSPSVAIDNEENVYLAFVENNQGPLHIYKHNQAYWEDLRINLQNSTQKVIEPFIEIDENNNLYLAYSKYKKDIVMTQKNGKNTGEELIKTSAWRIKVQKLENDSWVDCTDNLNYAGFISKGSGKGDPALKAFKNNLYVIFSDEEFDYSARVKRYVTN